MIDLDQRGQPRAQNSQAAGVGPCDIGAFEVASPAPPPPRPPPPPPGTVGATTWYFAEGYTATGFDEYLTIQNPNATAAQIAITYFLNGAPTVTKNINVPANSRYTVAVHEPAEGVGRNGGAGWQVSAKLVVTNGIGVVVERPMYFTYLGAITGGHNVLGATAPRQTWLFAEGYTGTGFDEYLTIQNPNPAAAPVKITYFLGGGQAPVVKDINVPANSRYTVTVHDAAEGVGRNQEVSAKVETTLAGGHRRRAADVLPLSRAPSPAGPQRHGRRRAAPHLALPRRQHQFRRRRVPHDHEPERRRGGGAADLLRRRRRPRRRRRSACRPTAATRSSCMRARTASGAG